MVCQKTKIKTKLIFIFKKTINFYRIKLNEHFIKGFTMKTKLLSLILLSTTLFAAGGIDKVNSFLENLSVALYAIGAIVLTIAFMWAGFKIMFQGQTLREVAPVFIGGVLVGSASAIAGYIIS